MSPMVVLSFAGLTDKYRRQHGKDECLNKGNQDLYQCDEDHKRDGDRGKAPSDVLIQLPEDEDQGDKGDDHNMTGHHVCKKTYHQGRRLYE